ncbi:hypothetical protein [Teredinibacter turnerae]|uniref:hypothetical protein n=1 Tax=Teredinibacter turnerae TaxID=2426 RepID=UPI00068865B3
MKISIEQIISRAGGPVEVGKACGVTYQAVQKWARNGLPRTDYTGETSYAIKIVEMVQARGGVCTLSEVMDASRARRGTGKRKPSNDQPLDGQAA